jgi:hypothetical protein
MWTRGWQTTITETDCWFQTVGFVTTLTARGGKREERGCGVKEGEGTGKGIGR